MDACVPSLCLEHKYCSVMSPLSTLSSHSLLTQCGCTAPGHPCVTTHQAIHSRRCSLTSPYPHYTSVTCRKMTVSPTFSCLTSIIKRETVLARRDPDGFYYLGVVIQEEEPGAFLIKFTKPCVDGERFPAILQKTSVCDIIQHEEALRHCIMPGDNVLAPWEPQLIRYGPGTVILGLETRDPLRATEDQELMISFWNGKKSTVPLRLAVWISPTVYHRIVDALHRPIGSRLSTQDTAQSSTTYVISDRCAAVPIPVCSADHFHKHRWNHYHSVHPHLPHCPCCCFPTRSGCNCCHDSKCQDWWSLSPRTTVYVQGKKELGNAELYSARKMKPDSRRQSEHHFSSSSSSESLDDESDDETSLTPQSTMVDSGVNTDSSLWEKPRLDISDRPEWKYWKRSQPEPFHRKPGIIKSENKLTSDLRAALSDTVGSSNQSSLFETILESPVRRLTMKDVLVHTDFNPSQKEQSPPAGERLGESDAITLQEKQEKQKRQHKKKMKHLEWEQKREDEAGQKSSDQQEAHRLKTLRHLQNEEQKLKDKQARNVTSMKAKMAAHEERSERHQTLATEDKKKEEHRLGHLRKVRERIDQKEFEKCVINEQRERNHMEEQSRRLQDHYKEVAERVLQAEQRGGRSGRRREQLMEA
ncbi:uncharacterized protein C11orf16 homolog [Bufo gargarizans]|uniref:uncharacterized protein C11orf16 homolog n=1 Tax=Bufo gargarizans TaxID=30331 RepID=UPI001CF204F8|nr:uncharacterized protein C11orf16 homolog [Bufo gargarizans]